MKKIFLLSVVFLVAFVSGILVGVYYLSRCEKCISEVKDPNNTFLAGWEAAKKRLDETGAYYLIDTKTPVKEINGQIVKIENNKAIIKIKPLAPLDDPSLDERVVSINGTTELLAYVKKDESQYQKELSEYNKKYSNASNEAALPEPYPSKLIQKPIASADLEIGQDVTVETGEDVREKKEFTADKIIVGYSRN